MGNAAPVAKQQTQGSCETAWARGVRCVGLACPASVGRAGCESGRAPSWLKRQRAYMMKYPLLGVYDDGVKLDGTDAWPLLKIAR